MDIIWCWADFKTGVRGSNLAVRSRGSIARIIGESTESVLEVRCSENGVERPGWDEATSKGRSLLLAVDKDDDFIYWGGLVRRRSSPINSPWVQVSADTIERYLGRRYVKSNLSWTNADPAQVAFDVLEEVTDLPPFEIDMTLTGSNGVDGYYDTSDNIRVGDILGDLSGLAVPIEWTVNLEWADAEHTQLRYVGRVAPRIGTAAGIAATQWRMPGNVTGGTFTEDFGDDTGANDVLAISSGEGQSKPKSTRYEATELLDDYARFEKRFTPAPSITSTTTLDQYAEAELARTRLGMTTLTVEANLDASPQVNRDWWLGDDIDVSITSERFPARVDSEGLLIPGYEARLRTVGWTIDLEARTITPRIKEAAVPDPGGSAGPPAHTLYGGGPYGSGAYGD